MLRQFFFPRKQNSQTVNKTKKKKGFWLFDVYRRRAEELEVLKSKLDSSNKELEDLKKTKSEDDGRINDLKESIQKQEDLLKEKQLEHERMYEELKRQLEDKVNTEKALSEERMEKETIMSNEKEELQRKLLEMKSEFEAAKMKDQEEIDTLQRKLSEKPVDDIPRETQEDIGKLRELLREKEEQIKEKLESSEEPHKRSMHELQEELYETKKELEAAKKEKEELEKKHEDDIKGFDKTQAELRRQVELASSSPEELIDNTQKCKDKLLQLYTELFNRQYDETNIEEEYLSKIYQKKLVYLYENMDIHNYVTSYTECSEGYARFITSFKDKYDNMEKISTKGSFYEDDDNMIPFVLHESSYLRDTDVENIKHCIEKFKSQEFMTIKDTVEKKIVDLNTNITKITEYSKKIISDDKQRIQTSDRALHVFGLFQKLSLEMNIGDKLNKYSRMSIAHYFIKYGPREELDMRFESSTLNLLIKYVWTYILVNEPQKEKLYFHTIISNIIENIPKQME